MSEASVHRTDRAEQDLMEIWSYIAIESPRAADRLLDRIEERTRQLAHLPSSAVARDELGSGIRSLVVERYLVFYRVSENAVSILRVLHGHRDIADEFIG